MELNGGTCEAGMRAWDTWLVRDVPANQLEVQGTWLCCSLLEVMF